MSPLSRDGAREGGEMPQPGNTTIKVTVVGAESLGASSVGEALRIILQPEGNRFVRWLRRVFGRSE